MVRGNWNNALTVLKISTRGASSKGRVLRDCIYAQALLEAFRYQEMRRILHVGMPHFGWGSRGNFGGSKQIAQGLLDSARSNQDLDIQVRAASSVVLGVYDPAVLSQISSSLLLAWMEIVCGDVDAAAKHLQACYY